MANFDENQKVSTEDMEQVAGGTATETSDDSRFLNVLLRGRPEQPERIGTWKASSGKYNPEISRAWASVGVTCRIYHKYLSRPNMYFIDGKQVSQAEAWKHAEDVVGKHLEVTDWDW